MARRSAAAEETKGFDDGESLYRKRGRGVVAVGNKDLDHLLTGIVKERGLIEFCLELFVLSIVDVRAAPLHIPSPSLSINIYIR
jgi:hypothetical protein